MNNKIKPHDLIFFENKTDFKENVKQYVLRVESRNHECFSGPYTCIKEGEESFISYGDRTFFFSSITGVQILCNTPPLTFDDLDTLESFFLRLQKTPTFLKIPEIKVGTDTYNCLNKRDDAYSYCRGETKVERLG